MDIPPFPPMNNNVKRDSTVEMLKFPADHSVDDETASVSANFGTTTCDFRRVSSQIQSLSKRVANITSNSLCICGFAADEWEVVNSQDY